MIFMCVRSLYYFKIFSVSLVIFLMKERGEKILLIPVVFEIGLAKLPHTFTLLILLLNMYFCFPLLFLQKAYLSRVAYYGLKGRYSKAILNCNEAIKICPKNVRAYLYRGVLKYYNKVRHFLLIYEV